MTRAQRLALLASAFTLVALTVSWLADALLRPPVYRWAESKATNIGTYVIAAAVQEQLLPLIEAGRLFTPVIGYSPSGVSSWNGMASG